MYKSNVEGCEDKNLERVNSNRTETETAPTKTLLVSFSLFPLNARSVIAYAQLGYFFLHKISDKPHDAPVESEFGSGHWSQI